MYDHADVLHSKPTLGSTDHGEIERVDLSRANPLHGPFGVVYQCPYLTVVREPVLYPSLAQGTQLRLIQGPPDLETFGVVILPIRPRPDGQEPLLGLLRQFRYAPQGWMSEIPRGGIGSHELNSTGAVRELREETGLPQPDLMIRMDDLVNDSGISTARTRYYLAAYMQENLPTGRHMGDPKEAISDLTWAPLSDWREAALQPPVEGRPVGGLDTFTAAAVGLAHLTGSFTRLEVVCGRIYEARADVAERLAAPLQADIRSGVDTFDIRIQCRDENAARKLREELPLLDLKAGETTDAQVSAFDVPLLTLVWLSQHGLVTRVEPLGS